MDIITAKEARNISNDYFPEEIAHSLNFIMLEITKAANCGRNKIFLYEEDCTKEMFSQINSKEFITTMKKYGYKVKRELKEYCNHFYYKITISW